ncbi:MAG: transposase, partial [Candidatus Tectomicrobia bacterium]|nr:transposase [Candidatus Tectomicrobia bacterium]
MGQTHDEITQNLAERLCWEVARRDDSRVARRLYRKQEIDGVYRLDEGAVLDGFFHFLQASGIMTLLEGVRGTAIQRAMIPYVQYVLLYGLKTLFGIESMNALPALLFSDEALMQLVGFNAQHVRQGVCQRGAAKRQGERTPGPIGSDTLAKNIVKWNLRDLEVVFNGSIRALAKAGVFGAKVTAIVDGTDVETTEHYTGCGQVTRKRRLEDKQGRVHEVEVTVYGWKVLLLIDAATKIPLAVKVGKIHEHEALWTRALVTQARLNLAGAARLHKVVFDKGFLDGSTLWWLDQQGLTFVVPAKAHMAVTADARAQAAAGEGVSVGHRVHTVRHGQGRTTWTERLATEVVGITGLTTYDQYGTPEHGRQHNRRDFQPHPINAVVVRQWRGKNYGPEGKTVFLTNASVTKPLQPFDDYDDRRLMEHCGIKEAKQPWDLGHPPQKTERAVRVHVLFTLLRFALATAYRLPCEQEATGSAPVGWQRWRRQLLEQTRDKVIVFAQGFYGIFHIAEYSLLLGV